ncbi:MAG: hypothetical protein AAB115_04230, partial [Pseudomonadota bacterium]
AAFFGFQDRFRALPGDYTNAAGANGNITGVASVAGCGTAGNGNGDGNGQIAANESILAWEHLSKAGFINGTYTCAAAESATTSPVNAYNIYLQLIYDAVYGTAAPTRHNLKTGSGIPVAVIAELDRKIDDGQPYAGTFQFSTYQGSNGVALTAPPGATACTTATTATSWNVVGGATNCGGATLF